MTATEKLNGNAPPAPPAPRRRRPTTLARVKTGLGDVILQLRSGELDPKRGNSLIYAYSTLAAVITGSEVERRLGELERLTKSVLPAPIPAWRGGLLVTPPVKGPETAQ